MSELFRLEQEQFKRTDDGKYATPAVTFVKLHLKWEDSVLCKAEYTVYGRS
jgi:hypothetical protein